MKNVLKGFIVIYMMMLTVMSFGQTENDTVVNNLPDLTLDYYNANTIIQRNYNYELIYQQRAIINKAVDLYHLSFVSIFATGILTGALTMNVFNWDPLVSISVATATGILSAIPLRRWSKRLFKRAKEMEMYPAISMYQDNYYGLSITDSF